MTTEAPIQIATPRRERVNAASSLFYFNVPVDAGDYRLEVSFVRDSGTGEAYVDPTIASRFTDLADWWHSDTDGMSVDFQSFEHPAYLRVLNELGEAAIPYILEDLETRHGHWFEALRQLSGDDTVDADAQGSMKRARDAWLRWGKAHKFI
jgi:hypothetical protein